MRRVGSGPEFAYAQPTWAVALLPHGLTPGGLGVQSPLDRRDHVMRKITGVVVLLFLIWPSLVTVASAQG